jgi:hypothetical protein
MQLNKVNEGNIVYKEYQNVCPFVGIGSHPPLQASVSPPLDPKEGGDSRLWGRRWGDPVCTTGEKAWHSEAYPVGEAQL